MDRHALLLANRALFINGVPQNIHDSTEGFLTHRHHNGLIGIGDFKSSANAV